MMKKSFFKTGSLRFVSFIYWIFLTYMIAAFIWWYVSLEKQNDEIASIKFNSIQLNDTALKAKVNSINVLRTRKQKQFLGEGLTFLILFLLGAVYVYRSLKKQLNYSNQQQNFMMAVTHELKTPIAVTQLNLETLQKRTLSEEQQKKLIDNALKETQRLDTLSNNIVNKEDNCRELMDFTIQYKFKKKNTAKAGFYTGEFKIVFSKDNEEKILITPINNKLNILITP